MNTNLKIVKRKNKIKKMKKIVSISSRILNFVQKLYELEQVISLKNKNIRIKNVQQPINSIRHFNGYYKNTFLKLKESDTFEFFNLTRMNSATYNYLLCLLEEHMEKTSIKTPISPDCRLALTLAHLSQGTSISNIANSWNLGKSTVRKIILEVCDVLWTVLSPVFVAEPNVEDLEKIGKDFFDLYNMPNCVGAIDGKHIDLQCPNSSESEQESVNDEITSMVLFAACNTNYSFTYVDVGTYGNQSDSGIFERSSLGSRLINKAIELPQPAKISKSENVVPYYFVGESRVFPFTDNIIKPYCIPLTNKEKTFNTALFKAQRLIVNALGILVARWRILQTTIYMQPANVKRIVLACISLHNFLLVPKKTNEYIPQCYCDWIDDSGETIKGLWRNEVDHYLSPILPTKVSNTFDVKYVEQIRDDLCHYASEKRE